jgi:hypothetical protein
MTDTGYVYRGDGNGKTPEQARAALATSKDARASGVPVPPAQPPVLKGAVRVPAFPAPPSRYPFRAIARDGGVWKLDSAVFGVKPETIRSAASSWAGDNGFKARTVLADQFVYVQFRACEVTR